MAAALAMAGGTAIAASASAESRAADAELDRGEAVEEGSGEDAEAAEDTCKPWLCPQPLYGVPLPDPFDLNQAPGGDDGGDPIEADEAESEREES